jgi:hypothetical protein
MGRKKNVLNRDFITGIKECNVYNTILKISGSDGAKENMGRNQEYKMNH